jgi:hypothetical protein
VDQRPLLPRRFRWPRRGALAAARWIARLWMVGR